MFIYEKAPAKINLFLDVLHKRDDGYHEVEMIMTQVDLADYIIIEKRNDDRITVETDVSFLPTDSRNLAYKAVEVMHQYLLEEKGMHVPKGVSVFIQKKIPIAAGLAGGSSDAAATLRGLNRLWNSHLSIEELSVLGEQIGSDVPYCVQGGTRLATGRGEKLFPCPAPPPCWVILVKPTIGISTGDIYQSFNIDKVRHEERPTLQSMQRALSDKDFKRICSSLNNVLETVTFEKYPQVAFLKSKLSQFGADGILMSGSGPTVFALIQKETRARRIYNALRGFCQEVHLVRLML